jgi:hypothetical protein
VSVASLNGGFTPEACSSDSVCSVVKARVQFSNARFFWAASLNWQLIAFDPIFSLTKPRPSANEHDHDTITLASFRAIPQLCRSRTGAVSCISASGAGYRKFSNRLPWTVQICWVIWRYRQPILEAVALKIGFLNGQKVWDRRQRGELEEHLRQPAEYWQLDHDRSCESDPSSWGRMLGPLPPMEERK